MYVKMCYIYLLKLHIKIFVKFDQRFYSTTNFVRINSSDRDSPRIVIIT